MRLFLQQKPTAGESPKFVQLILEQDLLGGWCLVKESGHTGGRSQLKREQFLQHDAAITAFEKAREPAAAVYREVEQAVPEVQPP